MALKLYSDSDIQNIANAIRGKNGSSDTYKVSQMASAITAIPTGGTTPTGTKQISITQNGTITEDVTNYANAEITVNVSGGSTSGITQDANGYLVLDSEAGSGGSGALRLIDTITIPADTRAINLDMTPYDDYDILLITENVELDSSDWLYYVRNGSSASGGSYNNGSKKVHTGVAFWRLPLAGSSSVIFANPSNISYTMTTDYSSTASTEPSTTNVYIYCYNSSRVIKAGSYYKVYGGNYADL